MTRYCEICGGRIRTGIKYCHRCRSLGRYGDREPPRMRLTELQLGFIVIGAAFVLIVIFGIVAIGLQGLPKGYGEIIFALTLILLAIIIFLIIWKKKRTNKISHEP